jgi:predicted nucleic acid-binding protein
LLEELTEVVAHPRLRVLIPVEDSDKLLELICHQAVIVYPDVQPPLCRDPDDYPVLAAAIAGKADYLVSGDDDLRDDPRLKAEMAELGVEIISVPEFLRVLDYLALGAGPEEGVEPPRNLR